MFMGKSTLRDEFPINVSIQAKKPITILAVSIAVLVLCIHNTKAYLETIIGGSSKGNNTIKSGKYGKKHKHSPFIGNAMSSVCLLEEHN